MKIVSKNNNVYYCEKCDYECSKSSHWKQHILTRKHQNGKNGNYNGNKKKAKFTNKMSKLFKNLCSQIRVKSPY